MSAGASSPPRVGPLRRAGRWLSLLVTVASLPALLIWVQLVVGWETLLAPWTALSPAAVALLTTLMAASHLGRAVRIHEYFHAIVGHAPLATLRLVLLHNLFNNLMPMRTGEAAFPLLMKRYFGSSYLSSAYALLWLRLLDLAALTGLSLAVILAAGSLGAAARAGTAAALSAVLAGLVLLPVLRSGGDRLAGGPGRFRRLAAALLASLPASPRRYWRIVLWSALSWAAKLLAFLWLAMRFTGLPPAQAMLGVAAGELSSVLPVHGLAGSGTYEGAMVGALVLSGAAQEPALLAAVNVHLLLLTASVLFGLAARLLPLPRPLRPGERAMG